jgi:hypothetical protein
LLEGEPAESSPSDSAVRRMEESDSIGEATAVGSTTVDSTSPQSRATCPAARASSS